MELLADQPATVRSLADIARHLGVSKPTCYPMVISLFEAGWLLRDPVTKGYRLGPALVPLGAAAARTNAPVELARPLMRDLADETNMATIAFIPTGTDLAVGEIVQPRTGRRASLGLRLGDTLEVAPPLGSSLAAWYPPELLSEWFTTGSKNSGIDEALLREQYSPVLAAIRSRGYAVECADQREQLLSETLADSRGVGIAGRRTVVAVREAQHRLGMDVAVGEIDPAEAYRPISINAVAFDANGLPAIAIAVVDSRTTMQGHRVTELGERVRAAAQRITAQLGGDSTGAQL